MPSAGVKGWLKGVNLFGVCCCRGRRGGRSCQTPFCEREHWSESLEDLASRRWTWADWCWISWRDADKHYTPARSGTSILQLSTSCAIPAAIVANLLHLLWTQILIFVGNSGWQFFSHNILLTDINRLRHGRVRISSLTKIYFKRFDINCIICKLD